MTEKIPNAILGTQVYNLVEPLKFRGVNFRDVETGSILTRKTLILAVNILPSSKSGSIVIVKNSIQLLMTSQVKSWP